MDSSLMEHLNKTEEIPEEIVLNQAWKVSLMEKIQKLTKKYVLKWLYVLSQISDDESYNRKNIEIFLDAVQNLYENIIVDTNELYQKHVEIVGKYTEKLEKLRIKLGLSPSVNIDQDEDLTLMKIIDSLETQISELTKQQLEKEQEIKDLKDRYTFLSKKLGAADEASSSSFSPPAIEEMKTKIETMAKIYDSRHEKFLAKKTAIMETMRENGIELEDTAFRNQILELSDDSIVITEEVMDEVDVLHEKVLELKDNIAIEFDAVKKKLEQLWNCFDYSVNKRVEFLLSVEPVSTSNLKKISKEVERLEKMKTDNLENLINIQIKKLYKLWDDCHCGGDVRNDFPIIYTQDFSDNNLTILEKEVAKWQKYFDDNRELLETLNSYITLYNNLTELKLNTDKNKLYENRGGVFSQEIRKMNILESRIKRNEQVLVKLSKQYLKHNGYAFKSFGKTVEELIEKNNSGKKTKHPSTPDSQKNVTRTPTYKGKITLKPESAKSTPRTPKITPKPESAKSTRRTPKITPKPESAKSTRRTPFQKQKKTKKGSPALPKFKLNETKHSPTKRLGWKPSRLSLSQARKESGEESWTSDYSEFEREVTSKNVPRSSEIKQ